MTQDTVSAHPQEDAQGTKEQTGQQVAEKAVSTKVSRPGLCPSPYWEKRIQRNLKQTQNEFLKYGRLDPHGIFKNQQRLNDFYSNRPVHPSRIIDNQNFARWAIKESLREYSPESQFEVTGEIMQGESVTMETGKQTVPKNIAEAIRAEGEKWVDSEDPNGAKEIVPEIVQEVGTMAEAIISASPNSLGPPIEACSSYLRMEKCGEYGRNKLSIWRSPLFPTLDGEDGRRGFLDNQITAIVWIMSRFLGKLPRLKIKQAGLWDRKQKRYVQEPETELEKMHRDRLRSPRYAGAILADSMGLGKTMTTIACLDILANQRLNAEKEDGKPKYRPMLILTPNQTVAAQWVDEIDHIASDRGVREIIVSGDGIQRQEHQTRVRCLTASEFKTWPRSMELDYVWDEGDMFAARVILVVAIDTWSGRTCISTGDDEATAKKWHSTFTESGRKFSIVVVDEAYKIRNTATRNWKSVALLNRHFTLLITATPCMNVLADLLGPVRLLWQGVEKYFEKKPAKWKVIDDMFKGHNDLRHLDQLLPWDDKQLVAGRPGLIARLIYKHRSSTPVGIQETRKSLKYFESLAILRRAPSSHLFEDWKQTRPVSLDGLLPKVDNFTVNIEPDHALAEAYQNAHVDLLVDYMESVNAWARRKEDNSELKPVLSTLIQFQLAAASMDVYRLDKLFSMNRFGTYATDILTMRKAGVNFLRLAPFLLEPEDPTPKVALDYVKLAVRKSPILRYILHYIKGNVLRKGPGGKIKKLLITEASPMLAYYYELVLQFLLIHCRTLHSGLSPEERKDLIASFNDDSDHSCQIMIQMYTVGFAGTNLHRSCSQVIIASQAYSLAVQWQAIHRIIRVGQNSDVRVYRLKVNNSFHSFRESRQIEKILPELGTRAQGPMNDVLVQLLNLFQFEVDDAWETPEAQQLLEDMNLLTDNTMYAEEEVQESSEGNDEESDEPAPKRLKAGNEATPKTGTDDEDSMEGLILESPEHNLLQTIFQENEEDSEQETGGSEEELESSEEESDEGSDSDSDGGILGKRNRESHELPRPTSTSNLFNSSFRPFLELKPRAEYYSEFKNFPREVKSYFCHKKNNLRRMLSFGNLENNNAETREWTVEDLDNTAVLERAMELMLRVRLGTNSLEMLPLPQIDFSLVSQGKLKELAGLLGEAKVTDQDIDEAREDSQGKPSKSQPDRAGVQRLVQEGRSIAEIDEALRDDIRNRDIRRGKKRMKDWDFEEEAVADQQIAAQLEVTREGALKSGDPDARSRLKSEPRNVKVKTEESDTVTLGNIKEAPKTETTAGKSKVKRESFIGDNPTGRRVKEESPSRAIVNLAHDSFTRNRMKNESQAGDTRGYSRDSALGKKVKEESPARSPIDLTDDDNIITTTHEPIVIDDSDEPIMVDDSDDDNNDNSDDDSEDGSDDSEESP
ncbi:SNF2 family N-terminal domain-containing protein [Hypoxylon sp. FL1857]|nr:SNF2 family N-terminal domain-containing protein [Hypoxylon sp. FL1857]